MRIAVKSTEAFSFSTDPHMIIMTKDMLDNHNVDNQAHQELFDKKANVSHTHNYAGSSSAGGAATSATKLATSRTIRTNLASTSTASFNGTANVTPGVTGTLPVANGGTGATTAANARTNLEITPANIGAAPTDHTHNYAGSSSAGGAATSATKLATARTITLSSDVTGSTTFDGSANKTITATLANSGVTAGTYGANVIKLAVSTWISNNRGLHSTTATSTWTAKQDCSVSFRYRVSSESVSYDYLNITAAGTQILANTGGSVTTNVLTTTLKTGQTIIFNYRKDGSNNTNEDCAKISEVKVTPTSATSATAVTTANFDTYFTAASARNALGLGNTTGALPIANGGTGATTAAAARTNLGITGTGTMTRDEINDVLAGKEGSTANNHSIYIGCETGNLSKGYCYNNVAIGAFALSSITGGQNKNVAIGNTALYKSTTGASNTAIGHSSLYKCSTGGGNTAIGEGALSSLETYNGCTGLGAGSEVTGNYQIQLGNSSSTVYAQKALVTRSDARDKLDIEDSPLGLDFIMKLRPRRYTFTKKGKIIDK